MSSDKSATNTTCRIKNIVFDFGGVLLDWNPRHLYRDYFSDNDEMEHFLTNICTKEWNEEQDKGRPISEAVKILQAQYPKYHEALQLWADKWDVMIKGEIPGSVELLNDIKSRGFNMLGLTNWSAESIQMMYLKYEFFGQFDGIVVSGEEHVVKPNERIFQILLDRYSINADESIFIDDNSDNIKAAQQLGFKTILFSNSANAREQLSEYFEI